MSDRNGTMDPDAALMLAVGRGDDAAFATLVEKYQDRVFGLACRYLGDRSTAEDLVQEAFLRVFKARKRYEPKAKFSTWLYRIVVNLCLNEIRGRKSRRAISLVYSTDGESGFEIDVEDRDERQPIEVLEEEELATRIKLVVADLPENQRIAILLNKYEGLSYEEVAGSMNMTVSAVKSLLTRARVKIKEKLLPYLGPVKRK